MSRFQTSSNLAMHLMRTCLLALYAATALLGSGGLHAIAPCTPCCKAETSPAVHSHQGCTHSHPHPHQPADESPRPDEPCDHESCLICEWAATPAVSVAVVAPPSLLELVAQLGPELVTRHASQAASAFSIRGPPPVA